MTDNFRIVDGLHLHADQTVINQNAAADRDILGQILIGDRNTSFVTLNFIRRQRKYLPSFERHMTVFERTDTNFRSFRVQHGRDRQPQLIADAADLVVITLMAFVCAVREVEARDIHACLHQRRNQMLLEQIRSHGANDFRLSDRRVHQAASIHKVPSSMAKPMLLYHKPPLL